MRTVLCGYGPRLPFPLISPWGARRHHRSTLTDFSSIDKYSEDNWGLSRIPGSFDSIAGWIDSMFRFGGQSRNPQLFLDPSPDSRLPQASPRVRRRHGECRAIPGAALAPLVETVAGKWRRPVPIFNTMLHDHTTSYIVGRWRRA